MKCFARITLLIIIFTQNFNSFAMVNFFNKAEIIKTLKNSHLISSWKTLPPHRQFFRYFLIALLANPELPISREKKNLFFSGGFLCLLLRNKYVTDRIKSARNAQKTIKDIVTTLTEDKKGFQEFIKRFKFMTEDYSDSLNFRLSSLIFSKNKLALLSSEKLPELIYTEQLSTLVYKFRINNGCYKLMQGNRFKTTYQNNNKMKIFCLEKSKLIDQVNSEILPLTRKLNQVNTRPIVFRCLLSWPLMIYAMRKNNSTLKILATLLSISKFDYLSLIGSNFYFEFFFTVLNFVNLKKNSEELSQELTKKEIKEFFSQLDKFMWAEDLKNWAEDFKNSTVTIEVTIEKINRIANVYFLTEIKKAISSEKTEVKEEDCVNFQNFIHASIYVHLFCRPGCSATPTQPCKLISSYGFLNSVNSTFDWMIADMEKNKTIYKFEETQKTKRIEYKDLKGEEQIKKLCIQEEMLMLKQNMKTELDIEDYFKEKIKEKTDEEKRIILEEIKYVILEGYQPKNHPDFKSNNIANLIKRNINKKTVKKIFWKILKLGPWFIILNFPH